MKHRLATIAATIAVLLLIPTAAWAGACDNASRTEHAPAETNNTIKGHWAYSDFGVLDEPVWGFVAPGTFGTPGNFQNGATDALLTGTGACEKDNRTDVNGIQNHRDC